VVIVAVLGSLIGTLIDYGIGYYLGRAAILRYGRIVRLNENHLQLTEVWFAKYGNISVLLARFIPLLGTLVAFPAGIAEMKIPRFIAYSLVGIFVWDAILTYMGVEAGRNFNTIVNTLQRYFLPIGLLATVITVVVVFLRLKSRKNDGLSENKNRPAQ
jgi:membrane protein DedA with SNARE-associated domain